MLLSAATFNQSEQAGSSIIHNCGRVGQGGRNRSCKRERGVEVLLPGGQALRTCARGCGRPASFRPTLTAYRTEEPGNLGVPLAAPTALSLVLVGKALENTLEGVRAHLTVIPFRYKPVRAAGKTLAKTVKEKTILSKQSLGSASSAPTPTTTTFAPSKENASDSIVQIIQTTKRISGSGGDKKQRTRGRRGKAHQPKQRKGQHHSSHPAETSSFFNTFSLEQSILLSTPISSTS
nr:uncharacterized protein LOC129046012 [Mirounga angustirostris]